MKMKAPLYSTVSCCVRCLLILLSWCKIRSCITVSAQKKVLPKENIPALLAFGDSIVDPGNNNEIPLTFIKANFPPYGKDFDDGKATGRFSNGRIPTDFLADALGVKKLLPAYLDPDLQDEELLTGVSFAASACGFDPMTSRVFNVKSMKDQLNMFKEYAAKVKAMVGEEKTNFIVSNSVYVVVAGTDDIVNTYFSTPFIRDDYDVDSYTDLIRNSASSFIEKLYKLGARKIFVSNAPPLGCIPSQRTLGGGPNRECAEDREIATQLYNNKLAVELKALGNRLPGSEIVCMDIYSIVLDLIQNGTNYGFEVVDKGCCGSGVIEVAVFCNVFSTTCEDRTEYLFWDSYHPSEKAYKIIVDQIVEKYMKHFF